MKNRLLIISASAGICAVLGFLATVLVKASEFPGLPSRMTAVEHAQADLSARVSQISSDIRVLGRDLDADAKRTRDSFESITATLSTINGKLGLMSEADVRQHEMMTAVKEKATSAAVNADAALHKAMEVSAEVHKQPHEERK